METGAAMRLFAAVVDAGSFSEAGRRLGLAPSSVSRGVSSLEDKLGVRLLDRTTRRLALTEAGRLYHESASRVLADMEAANQAVSRFEAAPRGTLRLNTGVVFGRLHIAPALPEFLRRYPEITVDLTLTDNYVDLVEEGADLAIRIGELRDSALIARKLAPNRRIICASPAYFEAHGRPEKPTDLCRHNCLAYKYQAGGKLTWRLRAPDGEDHALAVEGNLYVNNADALHACALEGLGIVILPSWVVGPDIQAGKLCNAFPGWQVTPTAMDTAIYAVYPHNRHLSPRVRAFIDYLVEVIGPRPYWEAGLEL